jgi:hypothetical protein
VQVMSSPVTVTIGRGAVGPRPVPAGANMVGTATDRVR